jgi:hypothetical protein
MNFVSEYNIITTKLYNNLLELSLYSKAIASRNVVVIIVEGYGMISIHSTYLTLFDLDDRQRYKVRFYKFQNYII